MRIMQEAEEIFPQEDDDSVEETLGHTNLRRERGACKCNGPVQETATRLGTTCQRVFQEAYAAEGQHESYARGMLIAYIESVAKHGTGLPGPVAAYCNAVSNRRPCKPAPATVFCIGCSFQEHAWAGLRFAYRMILETHIAARNGETLKSVHQARRTRFKLQERLAPPDAASIAASHAAALQRAWDDLDLSETLTELDEDWSMSLEETE